MRKRGRLQAGGVRTRRAGDSDGDERPAVATLLTVVASPSAPSTARARAGRAGGAVGMAGTAVFVVLSVAITLMLGVLIIRGWVIDTTSGPHGLGQDLAVAGLIALLLVAVGVAVGAIGYVVKRRAAR